MAAKMTRAEFSDKMNSIYGAIRHTYGYNDDADALIDFIIDATDSYYGEKVEAE